MFSIYINLCQIHSLYKCQIFQLYNFYVLYVLNISHKLYLYMKLYMVSELSISCVLFTLTAHPPPSPRSMCGRYASYWNAFIFCLVCLISLFMVFASSFFLFSSLFRLCTVVSCMSFFAISNCLPVCTV